MMSYTRPTLSQFHEIVEFFSSSENVLRRILKHQSCERVGRVAGQMFNYLSRSPDLTDKCTK